MKLRMRLWTVLAAASVALALAACDNRPFERAGKAVDRAVEKTGEKIHEATR
jgi:hypothetical protein